MKKHNFQRAAKSGGGALLFGSLAAIVSLLIITGIFAFILSKLKNPLSVLGIASLAALIISGALSSFITVKYKGEGGFLSALLSSLIASVLIFATGLIAGGGKISLSLLMNILCYILVSALFAKLASAKKKRRSRR